MGGLDEAKDSGQVLATGTKKRESHSQNSFEQLIARINPQTLAFPSMANKSREDFATRHSSTALLVIETQLQW